MGMFSFLEDAGNYESRKVGRFQKGDIFVSTVYVSDGKEPYETGIGHPDYNDGNLVIVQAYPNIEKAKKGQEKWVKIMTSRELPESLEDCANAEISKVFFGKQIFKRGKNE